MALRSAARNAWMLGIAVLALLPAACGGSSSGNGIAEKGPDEIIAAMKTAVGSASSVHVSGNVAGHAATLSLDLDLLAGQGGRGQLSQNGLEFELVQLGQTVYIRGSPAFYEHLGGPAAAQLLEGKWLKAPTSDPNFQAVASLTDFRELIDNALAKHGPLVKGAQTTVDGQKVISVHQANGGGTVYVATTGPPYPLQIAKSGASGGTITFDRWNEPVPLAPPQNAIDITKLTGG